MTSLDLAVNGEACALVRGQTDFHRHRGAVGKRGGFAHAQAQRADLGEVGQQPPGDLFDEGFEQVHVCLRAFGHDGLAQRPVVEHAGDVVVVDRLGDGDVDVIQGP